MNTIVSIIEKIRKLLTDANFKFHTLVAAFAAAFCAASFVNAFKWDFVKKSFYSYINKPVFILAVAFGTLTIAVICILIKDPAPAAWSLLVASFAFAVQLAVNQSVGIYFDVTLALVLFVVAKYVGCDNKLKLCGLKLSHRVSYIIVCVLFLIFTVVTACSTALEYAQFNNSTYDFGIFAQMFEQMAKTGLPNTSVERDGVISHFAVHFSPIYYLFLPGYMIFRTPYYLYAIQAIFVGMGIFPVFRIAKKLGFSEKMSVACGALYVLYPTIMNGCFYDFHENKFLSVLVLYLIYFLLEEKTVPVLIFTLLTLGVKEDAAIYVGAIALWYIFSKKKKLLGILMFGITCVYFVFAIKMIGVFGGEPMMSRLSDYYIGDQQNFFAIIKTCLFNTGYFLSRIIMQEKIAFIFWMLVPVMFAPFLTKRSSLLFLLIPMLVINLMPTGWSYQYNVDFQYTFGVAALIVFSAMVMLTEMSADKRRVAICFMLMASAVFMMSLTAGKIKGRVDGYSVNKAKIEETNEVLDLIPEDASVSASTNIAPHLYYVDDLQSFPEYYGQLTKTEYCILDTRFMSQKEFNGKGIIDDTYYLYASGGYAEIWRMSEYAASAGTK